MKIIGIYIVLVFSLIIKDALCFAQDTGTPAMFLSQFIKKESITGNEKNAGQFASDFCKSKGLYVKIFSDADSAYNFSASVYPLSCEKPNIILMSHLDVVPADDTAEWRFPPFSGKISSGFVWGRGAIDCKGLAAMQIFTLLNYLEKAKSQDLPYNITFLAVSGEEGGNYSGADFIAKNHLKELNPVVILGEGGSGATNLVPSHPEQIVFGISVAEKKALWLKLEAKSKTSGHSAAPPELYANKRLLRALIKLLDEKRLIKFGKIARKMFRELGKMEGGVKGFVIRHINWDVFWPFVSKYFDEGEVMHMLVYNTFVITNIYNPHIVANQIADKAYAILDCRLLPETNSERFIKKLENVVGPKITVSVISESPGAEPSDFDNIYYKNIADAITSIHPTSNVIPMLFPATTDNNYFRNQGIPVYGIIPVIFQQELIESVHNINERILVDDLTKGIKIYTIFLDNMMVTK